MDGGEPSSDRSDEDADDGATSDRDRLLSVADQLASDCDQALDDRRDVGAGPEDEQVREASRKQRAETSAVRARTAELRAQNAEERAVVTERSDDGPRPSLTEREREVLGMLADGLRNDAVAWRLSISALTVRSHVKNIMDKLDADTRTEAVATALRLDLID